MNMDNIMDISTFNGNYYNYVTRNLTSKIKLNKQGLHISSKMGCPKLVVSVQKWKLASKTNSQSFSIVASSSFPVIGYYQNCYGIKTKLYKCKCNVSAFIYVFIIPTETRLSDNFSTWSL